MCGTTSEMQAGSGPVRGSVTPRRVAGTSEQAIARLPSAAPESHAGGLGSTFRTTAVGDADGNAVDIAEQRAERRLAMLGILCVAVLGRVEVERQADLVGYPRRDLGRHAAGRSSADEHVKVGDNVERRRSGRSGDGAGDDSIGHDGSSPCNGTYPASVSSDGYSRVNSDRRRSDWLRSHVRATDRPGCQLRTARALRRRPARSLGWPNAHPFHARLGRPTARALPGRRGRTTGDHPSFPGPGRGRWPGLARGDRGHVADR